MPKSNAFDNDLLKLIFQATTVANIADNAASAPAANLTVALHTADPGAGGNQSTNEISYTGYARVNVVRTSSGWTVTGGTVNPAANIDFGTMTAGAGGTVTHFSVGTGVSNAMLYSGPVTPNISVVNGVTPRLSTSTAITEA